MIHETDGDTNCNWRAWYSHQMISSGTRGLGNKRTSGDHLKYSIVTMGLNTKKTPRDERKCSVT